MGSGDHRPHRPRVEHQDTGRHRAHRPAAVNWSLLDGAFAAAGASSYRYRPYRPSRGDLHPYRGGSLGTAAEILLALRLALAGWRLFGR